MLVDIYIDEDHRDHSDTLEEMQCDLYDEVLLDSGQTSGESNIDLCICYSCLHLHKGRVSTAFLYFKKKYMLLYYTFAYTDMSIFAHYYYYFYQSNI